MVRYKMKEPCATDIKATIDGKDGNLRLSRESVGELTISFLFLE